MHCLCLLAHCDARAHFSKNVHTSPAARTSIQRSLDIDIKQFRGNMDRPEPTQDEEAVLASAGQDWREDALAEASKRACEAPTFADFSQAFPAGVPLLRNRTVSGCDEALSDKLCLQRYQKSTDRACTNSTPR